MYSYDKSIDMYFIVVLPHGYPRCVTDCALCVCARVYPVFLFSKGVRFNGNCRLRNDHWSYEYLDGMRSCAESGACG